MSKCTAIISLLFSIVCYQAHGQQPYIDLLGVEYYYLPEKTDLSGVNQKGNVSLMKASLQAPIKIKEDYLLIQPAYEEYHISAPSLPATSLYGVSLSVTYIKQWNNKQWQTAFVVIPRLSSDLQYISGNDYQLGGAAVAIYKKRDDLDYKFGVYYNSEYFGPFVIPLFGMDWKINDRLTLFGLLPLSMNLEYKMRKNLYAGIALYTITNSYRLYNNDWYKIQDNHVKLYVNFYLTGNFVVMAEAGYSVLRKYSYGEGYGKESTETDLQYKDGPLLKAGIAWRIRLDDDKIK